MKKTMSVMLVSTAMFAFLPLLTFASTYEYVNTAGSVQTVVAVNSDQAIATPTNIDEHSGVMLVSTGATIPNTTPSNSTQNNTYGYINTSGVMNTVVASNSTQALNSPENIAFNSGVVLLSVNR